MSLENQVIKFEWDQGNQGKNLGHSVKDSEAEEVFYDKNKIVFEDIAHSQKELRLILIGRTKKGRLLYTVFTYRGNAIRIISSRDVNKKEVHLYEKAT